VAARHGGARRDPSNPELTVVDDATRAGQRHLSVQVRSPRLAPVVKVRLPADAGVIGAGWNSDGSVEPHGETGSFVADFFIDFPAIVFTSKRAVAQTCRRQ